jgi:hypothetical protein
MTRPNPIACPACMHTETMQAREHGREASYIDDDAAVMDWRPPFGGARGQQCSRWDDGSWLCRVCQLALSPHDAGVLLDAVLMHRDPHCDSITAGLHEDTRRAFRGGVAR